MVGAAKDVTVSRETRALLAQYEALLQQWNTTINLIGRESQADTWRRHFLDSLQLAAFLPGAAECGIDLGSGAGFPGLVLAIASNLHFHLVEADQRKAAFLRHVAATLRAPVTVHAQRVEQLSLPTVDVVTARAFAPLDRLLGIVSTVLKPTGMALLLKGARVGEELESASRLWMMEVKRHPSVTDADGSILQISGLSRLG